MVENKERELMSKARMALFDLKVLASFNGAEVTQLKTVLRQFQKLDDIVFK